MEEALMKTRQEAIKSIKWRPLTRNRNMRPVRVWINAGPTTGNEEIFRIRLLLDVIDGSINELYKMLKTAVDVRIAGTGTKQEKGGCWKYQLLSSDRKSVVNRNSVNLRTNDDYDTLIKIIGGKRKDNPVAVLTQEIAQDVDVPADASHSDNIAAMSEAKSNHKQSKDDEVIWDDSNWEEPLDEDGNPYFDPYDSDQFTRVLTKYAQEHKGLMDDGPQLDHVSRRTDKEGLDKESAEKATADANGDVITWG